MQQRYLSEYREKIRESQSETHNLHNQVSELTSQLIACKSEQSKAVTDLQRRHEQQLCQLIEQKDKIIGQLQLDCEVMNTMTLTSPIAMLSSTKQFFGSREQQSGNQLINKKGGTLSRVRSADFEDLPRQIDTKLIRPKNQLHPTDLKLLRMCQKMVNMSTHIECSHCSELFQTTVFYDHLKDIDPELRSNKSDSGIKSRVNDRRSTQQNH